MLGLAVLLSAEAVVAASEAAPAPPPSIPVETFDAIVAAWLEDTLLDAESAKIKVVVPPRPMSFKKTLILRVQGDGACYDINAKNAYGGYAGYDRTLVVVRDGKVIYHVSDLYPDGFTAFDVISTVCGDGGRTKRGYFSERDPGQTTRN